MFLLIRIVLCFLPLTFIAKASASDMRAYSGDTAKKGIKRLREVSETPIVSGTPTEKERIINSAVRMRKILLEGAPYLQEAATAIENKMFQLYEEDNGKVERAGQLGPYKGGILCLKMQILNNAESLSSDNFDKLCYAILGTISLKPRFDGIIDFLSTQGEAYNVYRENITKTRDGIEEIKEYIYSYYK